VLRAAMAVEFGYELRSGTGRAGRSGTAYGLISQDSRVMVSVCCIARGGIQVDLIAGNSNRRTDEAMHLAVLGDTGLIPGSI